MGFLDDLTKGGSLGSLTDMVTKNPDLMKAATSLLSESDASVGGSGGVNDLLAQLSSSGLGDQVASWLSNGANKSVTADQLLGALDNDTLKQFASKAGIDMSQVGPLLASVLPGLIDQLSPNGEAPKGNALDSLLAQFGGK